MKFIHIILVIVPLVFVTFTKAQSTSERPTEPTPSPDFKCPDREDSYHPHPTDCSSYYHCANGLAWLMKCAPPLYFNPKTNLCDYRENVDCKQTVVVSFNQKIRL